MIKLIFLILSFTMVFSLALNAASYKGQKEYMKKCKSCHGGGQDVAASKTMDEWRVLLSGSGKQLADLHVNNIKAKDSVEYFTGRRYKKKLKHLKDFMVKFAEDSGNVPACH